MTIVIESWANCDECGEERECLPEHITDSIRILREEGWSVSKKGFHYTVKCPNCRRGKGGA